MTDEELGRAVRALLRAVTAASVPTATGPEELVPLPEAARRAATTVRVLRAAIADGALLAYGRQRDRAVRPADLQRWIASRKVIHESEDDGDIDRRIRRLARTRSTP